MDDTKETYLLMGRTNNLMIVFKHDLREAFQKNTVTFDNLTYTGGVKKCHCFGEILCYLIEDFK